MADVDDKVQRQIAAQMEIERFKHRLQLRVVAAQFIAALALVGIIGFTLWQLMPSYSEVGEGLSEAAIAGVQETTSAISESVVEPAVTPAPATAADEPATTQSIKFGESFSTDKVQVRVTRASIEAPQVNLGEKTMAYKDRKMILTIEIVNPHARHILKVDDYAIRGDAFTFDKKIEIRDDAGNDFEKWAALDAISGFDDWHLLENSNPSASIDASAEESINPGESALRILAFEIPPRATEHLLLTLDMALFGAEGKGVFEIPANQIAGLTG